MITLAAKPPAPFSAGSLPPAVRDLLRTGHWDRTPRGARIIALSHIADGCLARARQGAKAEKCLRRVLQLARESRPEGLDLLQPSTDGGLWLTHWNLILADVQEGVPGADPTMFHAASQALAARSLAEKTAIVPSYVDLELRWPADQAATLASLARHDRLFGTHLVDEPLSHYRFLYEDGDTLPVSEATGSTATAHLPRGCALSWSIRYLAEVDPALARRWWKTYVEQYSVRALTLSGLREWPPGVDLEGDVDSGPIVLGVGAAATAFGLVAAATLGDEDTWDSLESTARLAEGLGLGKGAADMVLAVAIRDLGKHPLLVLGRGDRPATER